MKAVVAERGQVTIPKVLRDKLGIQPGTSLEFSIKNGALVARKAQTDPVTKVIGWIGTKIDTDRFVRGLRGSPDE